MLSKIQIHRKYNHNIVSLLSQVEHNITILLIIVLTARNAVGAKFCASTIDTFDTFLYLRDLVS